METILIYRDGIADIRYGSDHYPIKCATYQDALEAQQVVERIIEDSADDTECCCTDAWCDCHEDARNEEREEVISELQDALEQILQQDNWQPEDLLGCIHG